MEQRTEPDVSPYRVFSRAEWASLRQDTPMTLEPEEIVGTNGPVYWMLVPPPPPVGVVPSVIYQYCSVGVVVMSEKATSGKFALPL